jgi:hypothetical protein
LPRTSNAEGVFKFDSTPGAITLDWLVRTIQIHTTAMLGAAQRAHVSNDSAGLCIGAAVAAGAASAAELQATHWRHRWRTGASGVTGYTVAAPVEDWRRCAAAPVEDRSRRTSREPAAGVMDRRRSGQSSDSENRSLRTAGLGQPAGLRHSPAPTGVRRGTSDGHGWIGSKAVEIMGSRVGPAAVQE